MFSDRNIKITALLIWGLVYACAITMWLQNSIEVKKALLVMGVVPGLYLMGRFIIMPMLKRSGKQGSQRENSKLIHLALLVTGLSMLVGMAGPFLVDLNLITEETRGALAPRMNGIVTGLFFIIMGNYTPKMIAPLTEAACNPAKHQALQRQIGWTFFIAGFLYIGAWAELAPATAKTVTLIILAVCFLTVIPRALYHSLKAAGRKRSMDN